MRTDVDLASLPLAVLIGLGAVIIVQLALVVAALIDLYRRRSPARASATTWFWVAVIVLIGVVGPILYFALGRASAPAVDVPVPQRARSSSEIADALYGTDESAAPR